jgi:hypothetical protein
MRLKPSTLGLVWLSFAGGCADEMIGPDHSASEASHADRVANAKKKLLSKCPRYPAYVDQVFVLAVREYNEYGGPGSARDHVRDCIGYTIEAGANINQRLTVKLPAFTALGASVDSNDRQMVAWYMQWPGLDIELHDFDPDESETNLNSAVHRGFAEVTRVLLDHGANANGPTPALVQLMFGLVLTKNLAAESSADYPATAEALLKKTPPEAVAHAERAFVDIHGRSSIRWYAGGMNPLLIGYDRLMDGGNIAAHKGMIDFFLNHGYALRGLLANLRAVHDRAAMTVGYDLLTELTTELIQYAEKRGLR